MNRLQVRNIIYFLLLFLIWIVRCAGPAYTSKSLPEISPKVLLDQIHKHASKLETFQGIARFYVASPEGSFSGTMRVVLKAPDSLWMKIEGPLGIDLMAMRFVGDEALLYSPWENVVYHGSLADVDAIEMLPLGLGDTSHLLLGVTGLLVPDYSLLDSMHVLSFKGKQYILTERSGEQYWIEPKGPVVAKWEKCDHNGRSYQKWEGRKFKKRSGIRFPQQIQFANRYPEQRLTLQYEEVRMNKPLRKGWFGIRLPEGVEKVEL